MSGFVPLDAHTDAVTDCQYVERVPRQRAAEHLADIAYALTGGETLELRHEGREVKVPVADEVLLIRTSRSTGDRVEVAIQLSWSSPDVLDLASRE